MSPTHISSSSGTTSVRNTESASTGLTAGLVTIIWYSTTAPGIAFGLVVPLTGSETTVLSFTTVRGTVLLLCQVQMTEAATGMLMTRVSPVPATATGVVVPSMTQDSFAV